MSAQVLVWGDIPGFPHMLSDEEPWDAAKTWARAHSPGRECEVYVEGDGGCTDIYWMSADGEVKDATFGRLPPEEVAS